MNAIPDPHAYAAHLTASPALAELARSDDEPGDLPLSKLLDQQGVTLIASTDPERAAALRDATKPRRHWRVTKADLEAQVIAAAEAAERRAAELHEAYNEMSCCDDVVLSDGLASAIAYLRVQRDVARQQEAKAASDGRWLFDEACAQRRWRRVWKALALAGWAAFAVAVVWN